MKIIKRLFIKVTDDINVLKRRAVETCSSQIAMLKLSSLLTLFLFPDKNLNCSKLIGGYCAAR